jgi:hypothetical protein
VTRADQRFPVFDLGARRVLDARRFFAMSDLLSFLN